MASCGVIGTTDSYCARCSHTSGINFFSADYLLEEWERLIFNAEFEFDYILDFTELVEDKLLAPLKSEARTLFSRHTLEYNPGKETTHRRLLLELLSRTSFDTRSICKDIAEDTLNEDLYIVILHAKERELKIVPRLFAMLTLEVRAYISITRLIFLKQYFHISHNRL